MNIYGTTKLSVRVQILSNMNNSLQYIAKKQIKYDLYQFIQFINVSDISPHSLSSTIKMSVLTFRLEPITQAL